MGDVYGLHVIGAFLVGLMIATFFILLNFRHCVRLWFTQGVVAIGEWEN